MGIAPHLWLAVDIALIAGLTTSSGNAIPGIVNMEHIECVAVIDKQVIVFNTLPANLNATVSTTTVKSINLFPAIGFMSFQNTICEKLDVQT